MSGKQVSLDSFKGKTVVLNFWATWCPPCRGEMPEFDELHKEFQKSGEAVLLAVNLTDGRRETPERVAEFLKETGYTMTVLLDEKQEAASFFGVRYIPTTFVLDKDGNLIGQIQGATTKDAVLKLVRGRKNSGRGSSSSLSRRAACIRLALHAADAAGISDVPRGGDGAGQARERRQHHWLRRGFTLLFMALGATATAIGAALDAHRLLLQRASGIVILIFGLHFLGVSKSASSTLKRSSKSASNGAASSARCSSARPSRSAGRRASARSSARL